MLSTTLTRIRVTCFIAICLSLVACFVLFSRWRGSIASANKATPSGSNRLSSTQEWRENAVLTPAVGNTITVNSSADVTNGTDGFCTLREAITAANSNTASGATAGECAAGSSGADTIDLSGLSGTITLASVLPDISTEMSLNGPGSSVLTIQRGTQGFSISVFFISFSAKVTISGLTFQGVGGSPVSGNVGISSSGTLNLTDCVVSGFGAGIQNASQFTLTISNSVISGSLNGSGITNFSGTTNVINSTVSGNDSHGGFGSGIYNIGTLNVTNSIITGNRGNKAIDNGGGGTATIINSTVSNNLDGGILNNGNLSMTGGLVTGNTNGGIVSGGNSLLNGITITNNSNNSPNFFGRRRHFYHRRIGK